MPGWTAKRIECRNFEWAENAESETIQNVRPQKYYVSTWWKVSLGSRVAFGFWSEAIVGVVLYQIIKLFFGFFDQFRFDSAVAPST